MAGEPCCDRPAPADPISEAGTAAVPAAAGEDGPPRKTSLVDHTILVGYGRVGSLVGKSLSGAALPFLVIEDSEKPLAELRAEGIEAISGNGAAADIFAAANAAAARRLVLAIPDAFEAGQIIQRARSANARIEIIARAHSDAEVEHLTGLGADTVIMGEREIARGIIDQVLASAAAPESARS